MITVKADEKLFNQLKGLGHKVISLSSIVQNDTQMDTYDLVEWSRLVSIYAIELGDLHRMVLAHIADNHPTVYQQLKEYKDG